RFALVRAEVEKRARNFLVAGTKDQEALYIKDGGGGVFTEKLIEALRGNGDDDPDGVLTFTEVFSHVKRSVLQYIENDPTLKGHRQEPDQDKVIDKGDMLFFPSNNVHIKTSSQRELTPSGPFEVMHR